MFDKYTDDSNKKLGIIEKVITKKSYNFVIIRA